jgi:hypothetical protein
MVPEITTVWLPVAETVGTVPALQLLGVNQFVEDEPFQLLEVPDMIFSPTQCRSIKE